MERKHDFFDEKSLENLVKFHEEELMKILQGESPMNLFTRHTRGSLRDAGILTYINHVWDISKRAKKYL